MFIALVLLDMFWALSWILAVFSVILWAWEALSLALIIICVITAEPVIILTILLLNVLLAPPLFIQEPDIPAAVKGDVTLNAVDEVI